MFIQSGFADIKGIVLDAVGTLIEPSPSVSSAYVQAARRQGVDLDVATVKRRFREHFSTDEVDESRGPLATDEATERLRWRRIVARCLPEIPDVSRAFDELWAHFGDPSSWVVFTDVAPTISALIARGFRLCVASNFDGRLRGVTRGIPELRDWVEPLVISSEVGHRKPHPAFYLAACDRMGLPPEKVLCVGDDVKHDVIGPREAGLRSILVSRTGTPPDGVQCLSGLDEFLSVLDAIPAP